MIDSIVNRVVDEVCRRLVPEIETMFAEQQKKICELRSDLVSNMNEVAEAEQRVAKISREVADAVVARFRV